ncbi:MAG TPA: nickel-dependent lactate racemase [Firmicutes bacterium]|nr:nickel-dependent lactate racemase [Bacillota bacterium]
MKQVQIPFGNKTITIEAPADNLSWVASPRNLPGVPEPERAVEKALRNPIGLPTLDELVKKKGKRVVLLVDDMTRSTPQKVILPVLVNELNRVGVKDEEITALICLGTHRLMTTEEIINRYGEEMTTRIRFINHDYKDIENMVEVKVSDGSIPIMVNKIYYESDISIAIGNIIPHMYAGFAGGAKMVQPGVCGMVTTAETHYLAAENVHQITGNAENSVRQQIEYIARETGLTMILNTVLNADHEIVRVVAGDPVLAHREGVKTAEQIYCFEIAQPCDLVIASSYPADLDFWQSIKALNNCCMAVKPGGTLILAASDSEGIAPDHPDLVKLGTCNAQEAKEAYRRGEIKDKVALATYLAMNLNRERARIVLISDGINKEEASRIGLEWSESLSKAVEDECKKLTGDARIGIVTHGADLYFKIK